MQYDGRTEVGTSETRRRLLSLTSPASGSAAAPAAALSRGMLPHRLQCGGAAMLLQPARVAGLHSVEMHGSTQFRRMCTGGWRRPVSRWAHRNLAGEARDRAMRPYSSSETLRISSQLDIICLPCLKGTRQSDLRRTAFGHSIRARENRHQ